MNKGQQLDSLCAVFAILALTREEPIESVLVTVIDGYAHVAVLLRGKAPLQGKLEVLGGAPVFPSYPQTPRFLSHIQEAILSAFLKWEILLCDIWCSTILLNYSNLHFD